MLSVVYAITASLFFFFNDTATTEIYTLSLHDALPISRDRDARPSGEPLGGERGEGAAARHAAAQHRRSEEHTSELQSRLHLVCRLLLEKKKKTIQHSRLTKKQQCNVRDGVNGTAPRHT